MKPISEEIRSKLVALLLQDNSELSYDEVTIVLYYALNPSISSKEFNAVRDKINKAHYHDTHLSTEYLAWMYSTLFNIHADMIEK